LRKALNWIGPGLVCVVLPFLMVLSVVDRHPKFSPIDEAAHWDYVRRLPSDGIPSFGDRLLKSTLRELACRETRLEGLVVLPCDAPRLPFDRFPGGAYQYEAQQPPIYYALTAPIAKVVTKFTGVGEVGGTRIVGALWLTAGLLLMWHTSRLLTIDRLPMLGVTLAIGLAPLVVYYSSIVSNDSAGILSGALACWVGALTYVRQRSYVLLALAVGVVLALVKTSSAVPAGVVGFLLLLPVSHGVVTTRKLPWRHDTWRTTGKTGFALLGGAVAGSLLWIVYYRTFATIEPKSLPTFDVLRGGPVDTVTFLSQAKSFLAPLTDSYQPFSEWNPEVYALMQLVTIVAVVAGLGAGAFVAKRTWWSVSGPPTLGLLYIAGVVIGYGIWRSYDINPGVSGRYALPIVPVAALILAAGLQRRAGQWTLFIGGVVFAFISSWMILQTSLA
jgi:hypothetical protein